MEQPVEMRDILAEFMTKRLPRRPRPEASKSDLEPVKRTVKDLTDADQIIREWPGKPRKWSEVPPPIRKILGDLWEGRAKWPFLLWSKSPGTGKTCAGLAFADMIMLSRCLRFEQFTAEVNDVKFGREQSWTVKGLWHHLQRQRFVLVDDIGTRSKATDAQCDVIKGILDVRDGLPLMLTSNLPPEKLAHCYDARILDRLCMGVVIEASGGSRR